MEFPKIDKTNTLPADNRMAADVTIHSIGMSRTHCNAPSSAEHTKQNTLVPRRTQHSNTTTQNRTSQSKTQQNTTTQQNNNIEEKRTEQKITEGKRTDRKGTQQNRTERNGIDRHGTNQQHRREQNGTEQDRTEVKRTEQNGPEQNIIELTRIDQNRMERNGTEQNRWLAILSRLIRKIAEKSWTNRNGIDAIEAKLALQRYKDSGNLWQVARNFEIGFLTPNAQILASNKDN